MAKKFEDLELLDESGKPVIIKSLWQSQTAVLVFVRHFG